ncbi:MAG TPA: aminoacyl-tRNA hydrolase [Vicinamibacterales bacterium]|jgi:PTH1 family peptidyl-tRNA hydrolase
MKLIVGLGNPGAKYDGTRHNVGFAVVDRLAARHGAAWEAAPRGIEGLAARWRAADVVLAKPLTFMNLSGPAIVGLLQFFKIEVADLLVIVDEVQLETGRIKVNPDGSAGGHNGLKSVIGSLGSLQFARLRIGVGRGDRRRDLADHVLARFDADERNTIDDAMTTAVEAVELFVAEGLSASMSRFNRKPETGSGTQAAENGNEDN